MPPKIKDTGLVRPPILTYHLPLPFQNPQGPSLEVYNMAKSSPGMAVTDECKLKFLELKAKRKHRFIVFKIDEKIQQVMVEKLGKPDATYADFTASLPADECRYAVYDLNLPTDNTHQKSKVFFIAWLPDKSMATSKTLYASSKDRFKSELDDIQVGFVEAEKYEAVARKLQLENSKLKRELNVLKRKLSESEKEASGFKELSNERAKAPEEAEMHAANLKLSKGAEVPTKNVNVQNDAKGQVGTSEGLGVANLDSAAGKQDKLTKEVEVSTAPKINTVDAQTIVEGPVGGMGAPGIFKDDSQDKVTEGDNTGKEAKEDASVKKV